MAKALILIDYCNDFIADNGKLTIGKRGQEIEDSITDLAKEAYKRGDYIFFAFDAHKLNDEFHSESKLFPPHCIVGTDGRNPYGKLGDLFNQVKESNNIVFLDKTYYSAFAFTKLNQLLSERSINTIVLAGVLTDICVLHTAIDAYERGYNIEVVESAVASLTDSQNEFAINHMKNVLGAKII